MIIVVIPAYKPDIRFNDFISKLIKISDKIIIVDDGSGEDYRDIFKEAEKNKNVKVLRHAVNLGKGRSLKDAFNYVLNQYPEASGVVTADADGQHLIRDIIAVSDALRKSPNDFVLGCRNFKGMEIPWKSKFGNTLTRKICAFLCGVSVSDTQTGLRGISTDFMKTLMNTPGERYEYETNMLLECNKGIKITEIPITTVYDSRENHKTHFDPLRDSLTIYKAILTYSISSVLATVIDFLIFMISNRFGCSIWLSTYMARACSAFANFLMNKKAVFKSKENGVKQFFKYVLLVIVSGTFSAVAISRLESVISVNIFVVKVIVETCLFFFNYYIQRRFIFAKHRKDDV